jgi:hypothetical protein
MYHLAVVHWDRERLSVTWHRLWETCSTDYASPHELAFIPSDIPYIQWGSFLVRERDRLVPPDPERRDP